MQWLDENPDIVDWEYESLEISYVSNKSTGKMRKYIPDFLVTYANGARSVIEIKQRRKLTNAIVVKKSSAAIAWCAEHNCTFVVLTEIELRQLQLI